MILVLNENNHSKMPPCSASHSFNYFKFVTFIEKVVVMDLSYKVFLYDIIWPNKCEEHKDVIAVKIKLKHAHCMECFFEFELIDTENKKGSKISKRNKNEY